MGNLIKKEFEGNEVEIIMIEDSPYFELYSSGAALGYGRWTESKGKKYYKIEKTRIKKVIENGCISTLAHDGRTFLSEEDLYDFILEARTEKSKSFRKWVTHEILPSIRKTGGFIQDGREEEMILNYFPSFSEDVKMAMLQDILRKKKEMEPKAESFDRFMSAENVQSMNAVAKAVGMGRNNLFKFLRAEGILMKSNLPYQKYVDAGYFEVVEKDVAFGNKYKAYAQTFVTPKGIDYISKKIDNPVEH